MMKCTEIILNKIFSYEIVLKVIMQCVGCLHWPTAWPQFNDPISDLSCLP
jgi:hypothetical protein